MSLPRLATRVATVQALMNRTYAGAAVRDSAIPPLDTLTKDERLPFIAIYTDDSEFAAETGRGLMSSGGKFSLVIEMAISAQMQFEVENGQAVEAPGKPPTDAQMELLLDLMERQVKVALSDPDNEWGEMWRSLVAEVIAVKSMRGADSERGLRFAGRQLMIECKPYAEPPCGGAIGQLYTKFLAMLRASADQGLVGLADIVESTLTLPVVPENWKTEMRQLALTRGEADAMHLTPGLTDLTGEETVAEVIQDPQPSAP